MPEPTSPPGTGGSRKPPQPLDPRVTGPDPRGSAAPQDFVSAVGAELVLRTGTAAGVDGPPITLSCDFRAGSASGDHPTAKDACRDLQAALSARDPFAPVRADAICTQIFAGDEVVELSGAVLGPDGEPIDVSARYARNNGCEISRWDGMGAVLAPFGGAA